MAHYLAVVASRSRRGRLAAWLNSNDVQESEMFQTELSGGRVLTIVASDVKNSIVDSSFFIGLAIDHEAHEIGFGAAGWKGMNAHRAPQSHPLAGRFLELRWDRDSVSMQRDFSGSIAALETHGHGWYAFSDSLLTLASLRRGLGLPVKANEEALLARQRTLALTYQIISDETAVEDITFFPAGRFPRVRPGRLGGLALDTVAAPPQGSVIRTPTEYRERVREIACDLVGQAVPIEGVNVRLSLSGGHDSRLVLAAYRRAGTLDTIDVFSRGGTPAERPDFDVATALAARFGFSLNSPPATPHPRHFHASGTPLWAASHLGVYDRFLPGRSGTQPDSRRLVLDGTGAEILKGNYGWLTLTQLDARLQRDRVDPSPDAGLRREALIAQLEKGLRAANIDPELWNASERHYAAYRNGLHGAANSVFTLLALRPVQHPGMLALAHTDVSPSLTGGVHPEHGIADLLSLVSPELAAAPYLREDRNRSPHEVAETQLLYGGPLSASEVPAYATYGAPLDARNAPSAFSLRVAERSGFDFTASPDALLQRAEEFGAGAFDEGPLRRGHQQLLLLASKMLVQEGRPAHKAGPSIAKILTPGIFA